jgi:hypothetical protein
LRRKGLAYTSYIVAFAVPNLLIDKDLRIKECTLFSWKRSF